MAQQFLRWSQERCECCMMHKWMLPIFLLKLKYSTCLQVTAVSLNKCIFSVPAIIRSDLNRPQKFWNPAIISEMVTAMLWILSLRKWTFQFSYAKKYTVQVCILPLLALNENYFLCSNNSSDLTHRQILGDFQRFLRRSQDARAMIFHHCYATLSPHVRHRAEMQCVAVQLTLVWNTAKLLKISICWMQTAIMALNHNNNFPAIISLC